MPFPSGVHARLADYVVLFSFGTEERARPDREHTQHSSMIQNSGVGNVSAPPGWAHFLRIWILDTNDTIDSAVVWHVNVELKESVSKNPSNPLKLLDLFVVAAFEYFLEATGRVVEMTGLEAKRIQKAEPR